MFNAKIYVEAMEAPAFVDRNGITHVGRLLSHREMLAHFVKLQEAYTRADAAPGLLGEVMLEAAQLMFDADAIVALQDLPTFVLEEAFKDFFASHRRAAPDPIVANPIVANPTPGSD